MLITNIKKLLLPLFSILISINTYAEFEYYHCEKGMDSYWRFDIDAINDVSPDSLSKSRRKNSIGEITDLTNVAFSNDWFKVIINSGLITEVSYISRIGEESVRKITSSISSSEYDLGVCKNYIKDKDLSSFFKRNSEK